MTIAEWVEKSREEHRQLFGEIGLKTDCMHHHYRKGEHWCRACTNNYETGRLICEDKVCYFYAPREEMEETK